MRYKLWSSRNFRQVMYRQTDGQKAMYMSPPCISTGVLKNKMKQLDGVVSPPAFLWDPYVTVPNVIFDLDICGL